MAFSSTGLNLLIDSFGTDAPRVWTYRSSDAATAVNATGYFSKMGAGSRWPSSMANTTSTTGSGVLNGTPGMRYGDLVLCQESSGGATPGRCTWHAVTGSTADQASTSASTGWNTSYDITVSAHAST